VSSGLAADDVIFLQRLLRADGLYRAQPNGEFDVATDEALTQFDKRSAQIRDELGTFDLRSETAIYSLSLRAQREARLCLHRLTQQGIRARVLSGTRTYAQQNELYRQGRFGNPDKIVTNARGGYSNHNFGIAWDIGLFSPKGAYVTDDAAYSQAATVARAEGVEWGGDWKKFVDRPHYQLQINVTLAQLRSAFEQHDGGALFA
jgi:peptidoglycan LD-endopeptidase CwlK